MVENLLNYYTIDGQLHSMPFNTSNAILYYNKDMFREAGLDPEKPPTTYSEFKEYARRMTGNGSGASQGWGPRNGVMMTTLQQPLIWCDRQDVRRMIYSWLSSYGADGRICARSYAQRIDGTAGRVSAKGVDESRARCSNLRRSTR